MLLFAVNLFALHAIQSVVLSLPHQGPAHWSEPYSFPLCDPARNSLFPDATYHASWMDQTSAAQDCGCYTQLVSPLPYSEWCLMMFLDEPVPESSVVSMLPPPCPYVASEEVMNEFKKVQRLLDTPDAKRVFQKTWTLGRQIPADHALDVGVAEAYLVDAVHSVRRVDVMAPVRAEADKLLRSVTANANGVEAPLKKGIAYLALYWMGDSGKRDDGLLHLAIDTADSSCRYVALAAEDDRLYQMYDDLQLKALQPARMGVLEKYRSLAGYARYRQIRNAYLENDR